jgi:dihydroxyacetone kinase
LPGDSGPFYSTALIRASRILVPITDPTAHDWADAFRGAVEAISQLGGAKAGVRTMLDALVPAANALDGALEARAGCGAGLGRRDRATAGLPGQPTSAIGSHDLRQPRIWARVPSARPTQERSP